MKKINFKNFTFLALVLFMTAGLFSNNAEARKKKKYKGPIIVNQILRLSGTMTNNGTPTVEFAGIKEGDVLETSPKSAAVIRIPGLGIYRLGENTKLKLSKYGGRDVTKFDLEKGDLLCIYKRLGNHEVKSENALISPSGNSQSNVFWVADLSEKTAVALWDGKISIRAKNAKEAVAPTSTAAATPAAPAVTQAPISQAQIATSDTPVDSKQDPIKPTTPTVAAVISPQPAVPPGFVAELQATTTDSLKKFLVTDGKGVIEKEDPAAVLPDPRFIKELESLYALP